MGGWSNRVTWLNKLSIITFPNLLPLQIEGVKRRTWLRRDDAWTTKSRFYEKLGFFFSRILFKIWIISVFQNACPCSLKRTPARIETIEFNGLVHVYFCTHGRPQSHSFEFEERSFERLFIALFSKNVARPSNRSLNPQPVVSKSFWSVRRKFNVLPSRAPNQLNSIDCSFY